MGIPRRDCILPADRRGWAGESQVSSQYGCHARRVRYLSSSRGDGMTAVSLRVRLFLGSYAPLFAMLAIRFNDRWLRFACAALAIFAIASMWLIFRAARRIEPDPHKIVSITDRGGDVAGYLATYLLPFVTVSTPSARDVVVYALFVVIVGIVYIQSEMMQINPLLYLAGLKVFSVTTGDGWSGFLISRRQLRVDSEVLASRLENTLALERAKRESSGADDRELATRPRINPD